MLNQYLLELGVFPLNLDFCTSIIINILKQASLFQEDTQIV